MSYVRRMYFTWSRSSTVSGFGIISTQSDDVFMSKDEV
jgi:hypothetical protein